jgi:hypothetical protein
VNKDAKIPEDDWKKDWKPGTYDYLAPGYVPGTHEIERGEVTWHQPGAPRNAEDVAGGIAKQEHAPSEDSAE